MTAEKQGTVRVDDAELHYEIYGEHGETLLLLHGNGEDASCFSRQFEAFAQGRRVLALDSRGHGCSTHGTQRLTLRRMALDALAVLDALEVERCAVVGFSDGGNIALHLALEQPARVSRLVLAGANLYPAGVRLSTQLPVTIRYGLCGAMGLFSAQVRKKAEILGLMVREPRFRPEQLADIRCPALVLAGSDDLIKRSHTELIARSIPDARLALIAGSDHFIFAKQPERVNAEILAFLGQTG